MSCKYTLATIGAIRERDLAGVGGKRDLLVATLTRTAATSPAESYGLQPPTSIIVNDRNEQGIEIVDVYMHVESIAVLRFTNCPSPHLTFPGAKRRKLASWHLNSVQRPLIVQDDYSAHNSSTII
jgi:hypothetical protein